MNYWEKFEELNFLEQKEVCYEMFNINNDFQFEVDTERHFIGLETAYEDSEEVRSALCAAMKKLELL